MGKLIVDKEDLNGEIKLEVHDQHIEDSLILDCASKPDDRLGPAAKVILRQANNVTINEDDIKVTW